MITADFREDRVKVWVDDKGYCVKEVVRTGW